MQTYQKNKKKFLFGCLLVVMSSTAAIAENTGDRIKNTDPGKLAAVAEDIAFEARLNMIGVPGAVQVSQVADK